MYRVHSIVLNTYLGSTAAVAADDQTVVVVRIYAVAVAAAACAG